MVRNFQQARLSRALFYRTVDGNYLRCYALIFTPYENNEHHVRSQVNGVNEVNEDAVTELKGR